MQGFKVYFVDQLADWLAARLAILNLIKKSSAKSASNTPRSIENSIEALIIPVNTLKKIKKRIEKSLRNVCIIMGGNYLNVKKRDIFKREKPF